MRKQILGAAVLCLLAAHAQATPINGQSVADDAGGNIGPISPREALNQSKGGPPPLTFAGITVYGILDFDAFYQSHGSQASPYMNGNFIVNKNSAGPVFGLTDNSLSQSVVGVKAVEPVGKWLDVGFLRDFSIIADVSAGPDPTFARNQDACKSLVRANGTNNVPGTQSNSDAARCGQFLNGNVWGGIKSNRFGELRFGRQLTSLFEDQLLYFDPEHGGYAVSPFGSSGVYGGGFGATEDRFWNNALQYRKAFGALRTITTYRFPGAQEGGRAYSEDIGYDFSGVLNGLSLDGVWGQFKDAIASASLTSSAARASGSCQSLGISVQACPTTNILNATVSDNTAWAIMGSYSLVRFGMPSFAFMGGYQNIRLNNPAKTLPVGYQTIGGYNLNYTTTTFTSYTTARNIDNPWGGLRWNITPRLTGAVAYYLVHQDAYLRAGVPCTSPNANTGAQTQCAGSLTFVSTAFDYQVTPRINYYVGYSFTSVRNGLASGYTFTHNDNIVTGIRARI